VSALNGKRRGTDGDVKFNPFADLGEHAAEIKEAASKQQKDQQIDYRQSTTTEKIGPASI
jgi:hypothetical protein